MNRRKHSFELVNGDKYKNVKPFLGGVIGFEEGVLRGKVIGRLKLIDLTFVV